MTAALTPKPMDFTVESVARELCRRSLSDFVREFWDVVVPETLVWNWHMDLLCDELQAVAERVFRWELRAHDLVVNVPPGSTKSTIASIMFPAWVWTRMPSARTICASYTHSLSLDLSRKCRMVVLSDRYRAIFPEVQLSEDMNTKGHFANTKGGSRYTTSIGGSVTGLHGHFLIVDDPLDPNQAVSEADLAAANRWMTETLPTRKVDKAVSVTALIMQRLHQDDPTGQRLASPRGRVKHICLPAEITDDVKPKYVRSQYQNGLLDPNRLPRAVLDDAAVELGQFGYAGQFLQAPVPRSGGMFKVGQLAVERTAPRHWTQRVRYWDKAGTRDGGAYTVGVEMGLDCNGRFWVLDVVRGQWEAAERERIMRSVAQCDGVEVIVGVEQEPGSGGKESAEGTVRRLAGYRVRVDRPTGDKVLRADPFAVQVNAGNVTLVEGDWNKDYLQELRFFPRSKRKDQVDASSGAFALLSQPRRVAGGISRWRSKQKAAQAAREAAVAAHPRQPQVRVVRP